MELTDTEREIKTKKLRSLHEDIRSLDALYPDGFNNHYNALRVEAHNLEDDLGLPHRFKAPWER